MHNSIYCLFLLSKNVQKDIINDINCSNYELLGKKPTKNKIEFSIKYEELSTYICGSCGEPATHITTGWIYPVCSSCMKNINSKCVPIKEFYKFDSYKDILKEIENIKTNFKYDNYWK